MNDLRIYTDGAARNNGKENSIGAWAFVVYSGSDRKGSQSKVMETTTNNQAEMTAILKALEWCDKHGFKPTILTDSAYCKNGLESWMHKWIKNGWKKSDGKTPENLELWQQLYILFNKVKPTLVKVKGHSDVTGNIEADALCNVACDEFELNRRM